MPTLSRRAFLGWLAASVPAAALVRRAHAAAVDDISANPRTLRAIGEAVLPGELGPAGTSAVVASFQAWIAGYREGAELVHGYGTSKLDFTGPTPATRWASQLDALEATARTRYKKPFANLSIDVRRDMLREALVALKADRLMTVARAPHPALALLAHYYASTDATDRCYEAKIGKQTCRPLATSSRKPLPLARGVS